MRQELADTVNVHERSGIAVVDRSLDLMLTDLPAHLARKLVVNRVSGLGRNDTALDRTAYEGHVSDNVQELMTCRLVLPDQGLMIEKSQLLGIPMGHVDIVCELVETLLGHLLLIDDDSIVQVASLDVSGAEQRLYIPQKYESTGSGNLLLKVVAVLQRSKLAGKPL